MSAKQRSCKCPQCGQRYRRVEKPCDCKTSGWVYDGDGWDYCYIGHWEDCARFGLCSRPECRARLVPIQSRETATKPNNPLGKTERGG